MSRSWAGEGLNAHSVGKVRNDERLEPDVPLFHYTSAAVALDNILTDGTLRLGAPTGLNDPFESEPHWINLIDDLPDSEPTAGATMELFRRASDLLRSRCRLGCLSISGPNAGSSLAPFGDGWTRARMWAQYADNHAGVCLAFDAKRLVSIANQHVKNRSLALYAGPVSYRAQGGAPDAPITLLRSRAEAELGTVVDEQFPEFVEELYFRKAWDWSTETEYRVLVYGDVAEAEYLDVRKALTAVFVGPQFPEARINDLFARCGALVEDRAFRLLWRNGFAIPIPLHGRSTRRVDDWKLAPRPGERDLG